MPCLAQSPVYPIPLISSSGFMMLKSSLAEFFPEVGAVVRHQTLSK
jgi:hypothetical protein